MRIEQPKRICRCDLFGQGQMVISFYDAQHQSCSQSLD
jgi:hypothetical protein